jgi:hypothetical protein
MSMSRMIDYQTIYDKCDLSKIADECAYCSKPTYKGDHMLLPNREYDMSTWYRYCVSRFISDNVFAGDVKNDDKELNAIVDNIPDSIIKLIEKANAREEQYHYKQIVLTV